MVSLGFCTVAVLLLKNKKIDYKVVQNKAQASGISKSLYLVCYALQSKFSSFLSCITPGGYLVNENLLLQSKALLLDNSAEMLSLTKWEHCFSLMPLFKGKIEHIFFADVEAVLLHKILGD